MNLAHIIDGHRADHTAIVDGATRVTYAELTDRVAHLRGGLHRLGIQRGDRLALIAGNGIAFVETYLAALGLGAVVVPMNPQSPAPELSGELEVVRPKAVAFDASVTHARGNDDLFAGLTIQIALDHDAPSAVSLDALREAEPMPVVDVEPDDLAVLIFTSGTAGAPRAAMLTHGNLRANLEQGRAASARITEDDVVYAVLPMFHIFGLNVVLALTLAAGASLVVARRFDPHTTIADIRDCGVTVVPGAPPMWIDIAALADVPADSLSTVRLALTGAAKMPEDVTRQLLDRFGLELFEGYGLTEAAPIVTSSAGLPMKIGSVGKVLDGMDVRLVDDDDEDVLLGDAGEIWVKGPNVFAGYLDDPVQTAKVLTDDGWLRTGDVAVTDEDGYLYLVDRAKDLIIVSGFNVYPVEVEEVIAQHPGVDDVGVTGVPHPHTGETVKAWVVTRAGSTVTADEIIAWTTERLARYKCPTQVEFLDELPRNAAGKLLRRALV